MIESFKIDNLKCDGCVNTALKGVNTIDDVSNVVLTLENKTITFNYQKETTIDLIKSKLAELGYPVMEEASLLDKAKSYLNK